MAQETFSEFAVSIPRRHNIVRHGKSKLHLANVRDFLHLGSGPVGAPSADEFKATWQALRSGNSGRQGLPGIGDRHKVYKLIWALGEAAMDVDREFLNSGNPVITLHRDERKQKIMIRFTAVNQTLEVRRGCLGIAFNEGGASGINAATEQLINDFSPRLKPPPPPV